MMTDFMRAVLELTLISNSFGSSNGARLSSCPAQNARAHHRAHLLRHLLRHRLWLRGALLLAGGEHEGGGERLGRLYLGVVARDLHNVVGGLRVGVHRHRRPRHVPARQPARQRGAHTRTPTRRVHSAVRFCPYYPSAFIPVREWYILISVSTYTNAKTDQWKSGRRLWEIQVPIHYHRSTRIQAPSSQASGPGTVRSRQTVLRGTGERGVGRKYISSIRARCRIRHSRLCTLSVHNQTERLLPV